MILGIDYSFARPGASNIKNAGYGFVARYLASSAGKRITKAEAQDLLNNGLKVVVVFEDYANQALNGRAQGVSDAQQALAQANTIGLPSDRPIYFAVDFDATPNQQAAIDDYLRGCASVIGAQRVGIYGGYWVVKRCLDNSTAKWAWQTVAWSGGNIDSRVHIYQNGQSAFSGGADIDEARQTDYGQWPIESEDIVKPSEADVYNAFRQFANKEPANPDQVKYYMDRDIRELYHDLMFYEILPKLPEVQQAFKDFQPWLAIDTPPYTDQSTYYQNHTKGVLYNDLAVGLKKKLDSTPAPSGGLTPAQGASLSRIDQGVQWLQDTFKKIFNLGS